LKRWAALLAVLVVTGITGAALQDVEFDASIEAWFLDDDPDLLAYHRFLEHFDTDQMILVAWEDEDLWTDEGLVFVRDLTDALAGLDHVQSATSLARARTLEASPGVLSVTPLVDWDAPPDPAALRDRILVDELYVGKLISPDGRVPAVVLWVDNLVEEQGAKTELALAVKGACEPFAARRGVDFTYAGPTILDEAFFEYTARDLKTVFPAMLAVIVVAILALFGSPAALILPVTVVALACIWITGGLALFGGRITAVSSAVYPLVLGVGIASSVHITNRYLLLRKEGLVAREASDEALKRLLSPCFFTAATTVAGLASLQTATLGPVRQFGVQAAAGVAAAFLLTFALGPWILPRIGGRALRESRAAGRLDAGLDAAGRFALDRPRVVLAVSAVLLVTTLAGLAHLTIGSNVLNYFRDDAPVRTDLLFVDAALDGTTTLEIFVEGAGPDAMKEPDLLAGMRRVQEYIGPLTGVGDTISLADYLMELREAARGGDPAERRLPANRREAAQLLMMLDDSDDLERLVDFDFQRGRITATVKMSIVEQLASDVPEIEAAVKGMFAPPTKVSLTGTSKLIHNMQTYLLESQIRSLSLAFVTVLFALMIALRSVRLGLFSMIPNVLPIGMVLGIMGWSGIGLDPGTVMCGAVALGLVVDDTVHFLHYFREEINAGATLEEAVHRTLRATGRALVATTLILVAGFWVLTTASFRPNIYFGLLSGTAIAIALVADLVTLPAALAAIRPKLR